MSIINTIMDLLVEKKLSQKELTDHLGLDKSTFSQWKKGKSQSYNKYLSEIADFLGTTPSHLMGWNNETNEANAETTVEIKPIESNIGAVYTDSIRMIPLFNSVSAGFGAYACNEIVDYIPLRITSDYEAAETLCIRVKGDSMSPKIEDGDIIQVQKRSSVDSGSIAVVLLDGEEGLVKKVEYGKDWIELHSFNPYYPVRRFEGSEVLRLEVVGLVKKIIKDV